MADITLKVLAPIWQYQLPVEEEPAHIVCDGVSIDGSGHVVHADIVLTAPPTASDDINALLVEADLAEE